MAGCAFLFPGQASQQVGMGRDLWERFPTARATFAEADAILGFSLSKLCFDGPEEELKQTATTQPAVFVHSVAAWRLLTAQGAVATCAAGHSLGEYSALVAAGALDFAAGLELVKQRGRLMQQAGVERPGSMAAVLGLDEGKVGDLCARAAEVGIVVPANYNAPGQLVVSGETRAVARLGELARQAGAKRVMELAVSGAFHSPLMAPVAHQMEVLLRRVEMRAPRLPVIANVTARPGEDPEELRQNLIDQITRPVRWTESIRCLGQMGIRIALEVGPGRVLKGLVRRIDPALAVHSAGQVEDFAAAVAAIG